MGVNIKPLGVHNVDIEITEPFWGGDLLQSNNVAFYATRKDDEIQVFVRINYKLEAMTENEYSTLPMAAYVYGLSPIDLIDAPSIYQCYQLATEYLQGIINAIYSAQLHKGSIVLQISSASTVSSLIETVLDQIYLL